MPYDSGMALDRIVVDHQITGGVPCIQATRIPVATVVGLLAQGLGSAGIPAKYPQLSDDDIRASLEYAAEAAAERQLPLRVPA